MNPLSLERARVYSYSWMHADSLLCSPSSYDELVECLSYAKNNGIRVCPKGSGLSFGNVGLLNDNIIINLSNLNRVLSFDSDSGIIRVQAGIKTVDVLKYLIPYSRSLTALTGSKGNTIAGNVSNDVNGKDAWRCGSFCNNVVSMKVMTADCQIIEASRSHEPELFDAICGGLGLVGIVLEVSLKTIPVRSYNVTVQSKKSSGLKSTIEILEDATESADFAYCWVDTSPSGKSLGRGLCESANYTLDSANDNIKAVQNGFEMHPPLGFLGPKTFWGAMKLFYSISTHQAVGKVKYKIAPYESVKTTTYAKFQYPMLRWFSDWNLFFHPHGFREAQLLFTAEKFEEAFSEILRFCHLHQVPPWICGIKKHRKERGLLTFGGDGYSFTLNYALKGRSTKEVTYLEESIIGLTNQHQGKCYLGKYPFIRPHELVSMYPEFTKYATIKNKWDSNRLFWSDAAERFMANT